MQKCRLFSLFWAGLLMAGASLSANPSGETAISGVVSFEREGSNLTATSFSEKSIVEWQNFSISNGEQTHFQQPSTSSVSLNRVTGNNLTEIYGRLTSNGSIYLINPNGVLIGESGVVQTKNFLATTLNMNDQDFLQKDYIHMSGSSEASLRNEGYVEAIDGHIFFIAEEVVNNGHIKAFHGDALLTGSTSVVLVLLDANNPYIAIKRDLAIQGKVENSGLIEAVQIELQASGGNLFSLAVNHGGMVDATGFLEKEGKILLYSAVGDTEVSGHIHAVKSASEEGSFGGEVRIFGDAVEIKEGAEIVASGDLGGGRVLIGGDYQGKNKAIRNATTVTVDSGSSIDVSSTNGNAGRVILWSEEGTSFNGELFATSVEGNGGFVEVSSHINLACPGFVDTRSANGQTGTLLLDPYNITISTDITGDGGWTGGPPPAGTPYLFTPTSSAANVETQLHGGDLETKLASSNVEIVSSGVSADAGNITVLNPISWASDYQLWLNASGTIVVNANIINTSATTGMSTPVIKLTAAGGGTGDNLPGINVAAGVDITSAARGISLTGTGATGNACPGIYLDAAAYVNTTGGDIDITATGGASGQVNDGLSLYDEAYISTTGAGDITINAQGSGSATNNQGIRINTGYISSVNGGITITATGGGDGTDSDNYGILLGVAAATDSAYIASTGTGEISITATGGTGTASNMGIYMEADEDNSNVYISTASGTGTIFITATGGAGSGANNMGMLLSAAGTNAASYIDTATTDITITATGGSGTTQNEGLDIAVNSYIKSSNGGGIVITATGGTGTDHNYGLNLSNLNAQASLETTTGDITITATGGPGTNSYGFTSQGIIQTTSGNISITGFSSNSAGIQASAGSSFYSTLGGTITFTTDDVPGGSITGDTINTTGDFIFQPYTPSLSIGLGDLSSGDWKLIDEDIGLAAQGEARTIFGRSNSTGSVNINVLLNSVTGNLIVYGKDFSFTNPLSVAAGSTATLTGTTGINSLLGANQLTNWTLNGPYSGNVYDVNFSNIQTLTGGTAQDTFIFYPGAVYSFIDGGDETPTSNNTLDYRNYGSSVTVDWNKKTAPNLGGFTRIQYVLGAVIGGSQEILNGVLAVSTPYTKNPDTDPWVNYDQNNHKTGTETGATGGSRVVEYSPPGFVNTMRNINAPKELEKGVERLGSVDEEGKAALNRILNMGKTGDEDSEFLIKSETRSDIKIVPKTQEPSKKEEIKTETNLTDQSGKIGSSEWEAVKTKLAEFKSPLIQEIVKQMKAQEKAPTARKSDQTIKEVVEEMSKKAADQITQNSAAAHAQAEAARKTSVQDAVKQAIAELNQQALENLKKQAAIAQMTPAKVLQILTAETGTSTQQPVQEDPSITLVDVAVAVASPYEASVEKVAGSAENIKLLNQDIQGQVAEAVQTTEALRSDVAALEKTVAKVKSPQEAIQTMSEIYEQTQETESILSQIGTNAKRLQSSRDDFAGYVKKFNQEMSSTTELDVKILNLKVELEQLQETGGETSARQAEINADLASLTQLKNTVEAEIATTNTALLTAIERDAKLAKFTDSEIRKQAAISMMAQQNVLKSAGALLYNEF